MQKPAIPDIEKERLEMLRAINILDTPAEERFDRLTRMAKRMFNVPIALVSLVDKNRQWFKSCVGISATETSREISFCGHAILDDEVFIIPNAAIDERFADNPLVVDEPKIRFYAGCPLNVCGYRLGTLCIIDQEARVFNQADVEALKDLATMVEQEFTAIQLSTIDELTGIANRRGFLSTAKNSLSLSIRNLYACTLIFIDLDNFKSINDQFGHAEGDKVLLAFSTLMKNTFRDTDVIARIGGDEFVMLLNGTTEKEAIIAIDTFRQVVDTHNKAMKNQYDILFSHGIVEFNPEKHEDIEALIKEGDSAMYIHKNLTKVS